MESELDEDESGEVDADAPCCKVARTAAAYEVTDVAAELPERRRAGDSFRDLANYFNTHVTEQALKRADVKSGTSVLSALVGDDIASAVFHVLRGDGDVDIRRAELRARLADVGVDVEALEAAFVSYVTVRSHLQDCLGVEAEKSVPDFEKTVNTVWWARTREENIIQNALDRAVRTDEIRTGPLAAEVFVRVTCETCGNTFYVEELLNERRCDCSGSPRE